MACAAGFVVLAVDLRGHGDSAGRADGPLELDLIAAADFLRSRPEVDDRRLCYRGSSMGAFYGLKAAAAARFSAVTLVCPASEQVILDAIDQRERDAREDPAFDQEGSTRWDIAAMRHYFEAEDSLSRASLITCPVLLIHARGDDVVPFGHSLRLMEALAGEATLLALPGGTHTSAQHDPHVHRLTVQWLSTHAAGGRVGGAEAST